MFLRPSLDISVINERQKTISVLLRPRNAQLVGSIRSKLKKIKNIRTSLLHIRKGVTLPTGRASVNRSAWTNLQRFAAYTIELRNEIRQIPEGEDIAIIAKVRNLPNMDTRAVAPPFPFPLLSFSKYPIILLDA